MLEAVDGASTAVSAALAAGVEVVEVQHAPGLTAVEALLADVWGTPRTSPPIPLDLLCGFAHAGGQVAAAYDRSGGALAGAAVAIGAPGSRSTYSLIAAVSPARRGAGVGLALKLHQREWSLAHGNPVLRWTFDPLVRRNARFNLARLGARVTDYRPEFFGVMHDAVNGGDLSDRVVVDWALDEPLAGAGSVGTAPGPGAAVVATGPDGDPAVLASGSSRWVRVPTDVVSLRPAEPVTALGWRRLVRSWLGDPVRSGTAAVVGFTADGWYHLEEAGP